MSISDYKDIELELVKEAQDNRIKAYLIENEVNKILLHGYNDSSSNEYIVMFTDKRILFLELSMNSSATKVSKVTIKYSNFYSYSISSSETYIYVIETFSIKAINGIDIDLRFKKSNTDILKDGIKKLEELLIEKL